MVTASYGYETTHEKNQAAAKDIKHEVNKAGNRVKEAVCLESDAECMKQKAEHRIQETGEEIENKASEVKNKVD